MDCEPPKLTNKRIFLFWLPLESTWLMMAMEGALMSAIIARMAAPKFNLAAFGVAFSFLLILEAPVMMIISATSALVIDRDSFLKMRRFTFALIGIVTLLMGITILPSVFSFLSRKMIGLPENVAQLTYLALLIFSPVPWAIGYRRFYQGVLIRHNQTRYVAFGTAIRLTGLTSIGLLLFRFTRLDGVVVGAVTLLTAVILEAVSSRIMARGIINKLLSETEGIGVENKGPLTYLAIINFYLPMAVTSLLALGVQPSVTFFVGKSRMAVESLAVLPVISGLLFLFMSCGMSFHEVNIALLGTQNRNYKELRTFAFGLGFITVGMLAGIGFTPLSQFWFHRVAGLSLDLTQFTITPVKILTLMPGLWMWLSFQRSVLVSNRNTGPMTYATALELLTILVILFITVFYLGVIGAVAAALALVVGRIAGILALIKPFSQVLKSADDPNSVTYRER